MTQNSTNLSTHPHDADLLEYPKSLNSFDNNEEDDWDDDDDGDDD